MIESKVLVEEQKLINDIDENELVKPVVDQDKMAALRAKMNAKKEESMPLKIVERKKHSIKYGVISLGQAGGRIGVAFYNLGYDVVCMNTAPQDLELISIPEANKLLLDYGMGGAAKNLSIGQAAAESHRAEIYELIHDRLANAEMLFIATSLGGGSGAGAVETVIDIASTTNKPIVIIAVLPLNSDDAQTKKNSLETLAKLAENIQTKKIHNLIVVDNARIESILSDVSALDFFNVANKAIVEPLDVFNTLSRMPSAVKPLDSTEFGYLMTDGGGLTVYGQTSVSDFTEETSLAEAIINSSSNMLATGFDFGMTKYVGVMMSAPKSVWDQISSATLHYAMSMIDELCKNPSTTFKGVYTVDSDEPVVKIYTMFTGLGLPDSRVEQLKRESEELTKKMKEKEGTRNLSLKIDLGKDQQATMADKIKEKIAKKNSGFNSLFSGSITDRRKQ